MVIGNPAYTMSVAVYLLKISYFFDNMRCTDHGISIVYTRRGVYLKCKYFIHDFIVKIDDN